jgi:phage terminase large subunit
MTYTREEFGKELKQRVANKEEMESIAHWALIIYLDHCLEIDSTFIDILLTLNRMEDDPQFAYSYEELNQIADDLITGKEVRL